ncbi:NUDIX domain-containing protein [Candidatus Leptofilum sp.]|uniref:NUDIX domain-containing protein n=1 Tax=Candidatus Leptofilum sp. TaxID=3241576 RepID=UPI003B58DF4D
MVKIIRGERVGKQGRLAIGCSAAVFDDQNQILLIRRADNGLWAVPGGYMEAGESLTEACAREVLEETGLRIQVQRLISVYTNPHLLLKYSDGNRWQLTILHFAAKSLSGELTTGNETLDVRFFAQGEIQGLKMRSIDQLRIADAFTNQEITFIREEF